MRHVKIKYLLPLFITIFILLWKWLDIIMDRKDPHATLQSIISIDINSSISSSKDYGIIPKFITIAIVSCRDRYEGTVNLIKSIITLSTEELVIIIFTETDLIPKFSLIHLEWPQDLQKRVIMDVREATFTSDIKDSTWRNLFKTCAAVRLFLPDLLYEVDSVIYLDTDILLLTPIQKLWQHFSFMNSSHMAAMTQEHEDPATGWYNRFAKHPYYGKLGVNSGVMLMNLTRMRKFGWGEYLSPILTEFGKSISWGDQDIINIIFHYHPDKLYLLGCEYNYRPDHCMYMSVCKSAHSTGVFVLHGNRGVFYNEKQPAFKAIYNAWNVFKVGQDLRQHLYYVMQRNLIQVPKSNCRKVYNIFLMNLEVLVNL